VITLLKYAISIAIWTVVAFAFLIAGNPPLFAFWALFGLIMLLGWFFKIVWKWFIGIFFPSIQPRVYILFVLLLMAVFLFLFESFVIPGWNVWNVEKENVEREFPIDKMMPQAKTTVIRGIEIDAPPKVVYPFVQKLATEGILSFKVNLIDLIRNHPAKMIIQDLPEIEVGDRFLAGDVVQAKDNQGITIELYRQRFPFSSFNRICAGYYLRKGEKNSTLLLLKIKADYSGFVPWFSAKYLIEIADFFVSRYQLNRIKILAEQADSGD